MKTKRLYALAAVNTAGGSLYQKVLIAFLILALMLAYLPVASVFAAPAGSQGTPENIDALQLEWRNKLGNLRVYGLFYDRIRLLPADFEKQEDLAQAQMYLDKYGFALRQANTVAFNHTGFDLKGNVTNEIQADKTVKDLAMYLSMMRGFREKMDAVGS